MSDTGDYEICLECGHLKGYHDGAGCTDHLPNSDPCPCTICVDMPGCEPHQLPGLEATIEHLERLYGKYKKVVRLATSEAFRVPTRDIIVKGVKEQELDQYPRWEEP